MQAWFTKIEPAYRETLKHQVEVSPDAGINGGMLRTYAQGAKEITTVVYPVRWFLAQQDLVRALLAAQPTFMDTAEERLCWALFLMATVGEGLFALNAGDLIWGRAFFGVPPWVARVLRDAQASSAKGFGAQIRALLEAAADTSRPIPMEFRASPSMQRLYAAYAKDGPVATKRKKLNLTVPAIQGIPFGLPTAKPWPAGACPADAIARMRFTGYWNPEWDKGMPYMRHSSVGPIVMGCGTMNKAPFLTLPLINNDVYNRPSWWLRNDANVQSMHIPWSKGSTFKALYNQQIGITARKRKTDDPSLPDAIPYRFMPDYSATAWRDYIYNLPAPTTEALRPLAEFNKLMAAKWSFLSFAYQFDRLGDSGNTLGSPFDPLALGDFRVPTGFRFVPTLPELVQFTAKSPAFNVAYLSDEYRVWGEWFAAIDYPELVQTLQTAWVSYLANGLLMPGSTDVIQAFLGHDDVREIHKNDGRARWLAIFAPAVSAIGAVIDAYYGNYASAGGNLKATYEGVKRESESRKDLKPSDLFVVMPDDAWLRSGGVSADLEAKTFPKDMVFLSSTHGNTATVLRRYAVAFENALTMIRAAMPVQVPKFYAGGRAAAFAADSKIKAAPPKAVQKRKVVLPAAQRTRVLTFGAVAAVAAAGAWFYRKKVRR